MKNEGWMRTGILPKRKVRFIRDAGYGRGEHENSSPGETKYSVTPSVRGRVARHRPETSSGVGPRPPSKGPLVSMGPANCVLKRLAALLTCASRLDPATTATAASGHDPW